MTLIFTLGWDEKFQIRSIIRNSIKESAKVIAILGSPVDEKSRAAKERLKAFVQQYLSNSTFEEVVVDPLDFPSCVAEIKRVLKRARPPIIANLSGGMRALVAATLLALLSMNMPIKIEIELENFQGVVDFRSTILSLPKLDDEEISLLREAQDREISLQLATEILNIPKATAHKKLEKLASLMFLEKEYRGRQAIYRITKTGLIALSLLT